MDMSFSGIEQICKDVELASSDGYLYLIDGDGEIIYHPGSSSSMPDCWRRTTGRPPGMRTAAMPRPSAAPSAR